MTQECTPQHDGHGQRLREMEEEALARVGETLKYNALLDAFRAHAPLGDFVQIIPKEAEDDPK